MAKFVMVISLLVWGGIFMLGRFLTLMAGDLTNRLTFGIRGNKRAPDWMILLALFSVGTSVALWVFTLGTSAPASRIVPTGSSLTSFALIWLVMDWPDLRSIWIEKLLQDPGAFTRSLSRILWMLFFLGWGLFILAVWVAGQ